MLRVEKGQYIGSSTNSPCRASQSSLAVSVSDPMAPTTVIGGMQTTTGGGGTSAGAGAGRLHQADGGSQSRAAGVTGATAGGTASNPPPEGPNRIDELAEEIKGWLGEGAKIIVNKSGDRIIMSADGLTKVRFDINNPAPHKNPHVHFEQLINGKWRPVNPSTPRIYPKDVPHN